MKKLTEAAKNIIVTEAILRAMNVANSPERLALKSAGFLDTYTLGDFLKMRGSVPTRMFNVLKNTIKVEEHERSIKILFDDKARNGYLAVTRSGSVSYRLRRKKANKSTHTRVHSNGAVHSLRHFFGNELVQVCKPAGIGALSTMNKTSDRHDGKIQQEAVFDTPGPDLVRRTLTVKEGGVSTLHQISSVYKVEEMSNGDTVLANIRGQAHGKAITDSAGNVTFKSNFEGEDDFICEWDFVCRTLVLRHIGGRHGVEFTYFANEVPNKIDTVRMQNMTKDEYSHILVAPYTPKTIKA